MAKVKFYSVWKGRNPGVYDTWKSCQAQTDGFALAKFKSFQTRAEADDAFAMGWEGFYGKAAPLVVTKRTTPKGVVPAGPIEESICVDAAWNTKTGIVEYRCVETATRKELFRQGPFPDGTINVGEFLVIVHALSWCKKNGLVMPIYSDSYNAIKWVTQKKVNTQLEPTTRNKKLFAMLDRSIELLENNKYPNPVLKWETKTWGENPADFGRK